MYLFLPIILIFAFFISKHSILFLVRMKIILIFVDNNDALVCNSCNDAECRYQASISKQCSPSTIYCTVSTQLIL